MSQFVGPKNRLLLSPETGVPLRYASDGERMVPGARRVEASVGHPCVVCGQVQPTALGPPELAHLARCRACGMVSVRDLPTEETLSLVYSESYFRSAESQLVGYDNYEADHLNIRRTSERRLRLIGRHSRPPGRLLDVGCALGFFLQQAQRQGWGVAGVDVSSYAVEYVKKHIGCEVYCGELDTTYYPEGTFDVVTMWDVIEHMRDPFVQLSHCHHVLRAGGILALSTPDISSLVARMTGPRWMGFKLADEHLHYFSRSTLRQLLGRAGFELVDSMHIGKHVTIRFFLKRLGMYAPKLAAMLSDVVRDSRLAHVPIYVNPRDIVCVVARKAAT